MVKLKRKKSIGEKRIEKLKEENEMLKLQLKARESELEEVKGELEEIHKSISYRVGRWIAETRIGGTLKKFFWKIFKIK